MANRRYSIGEQPPRKETIHDHCPALTRDIGQAEHTMRALLERLLDEAGLSFPEWTVLILLDGAGQLTFSELVQRQVDGRVVPEGAARATVDGLLSRGLLAPADDAHGSGGDGEDPRLTPTAAGEAVYRPVRWTVSEHCGSAGHLAPEDQPEAIAMAIVKWADRHQLR